MVRTPAKHDEIAFLIVTHFVKLHGDTDPSMLPAFAADIRLALPRLTDAEVRRLWSRHTGWDV